MYATALLPVLLAVGCMPNEDIWLLQVPFLLEPSCEESISHNFREAYIPTPTTGDWTEDEYSEQSDALYFAQISMLNSTTATMVLAGQVWPGTSDTKGEWEFAWTGNSDDRLSREHDEGYRYTEQRYAETVETVQLTIDGKSASGSWDIDYTSDDTYTETDEWDLEVGMPSGDIPAGLYLVYDDGEFEGLPQGNASNDNECQDATCQLRVQTTCRDGRDFDATLTGYTAEEAYDQLEAVTQPHGP